MNIKKGFILFAFAQAIGLAFVTYYTFLRAYTHNYKTTVLINHYGEAHFELVLVTVTFITILIGFILYLKDFKDTTVQTKTE